jgi:hypothetical protein
MDAGDHSPMSLLTHSTREWSCLEPTPYLCRILAIRLAELPGEIYLFTGNDPIADHHQHGHNQEQYPPRIHQERHPQVEQRQRDIDRITTVAEGSLSPIAAKLIRYPFDLAGHAA